MKKSYNLCFIKLKISALWKVSLIFFKLSHRENTCKTHIWQRTVCRTHKILSDISPKIYGCQISSRKAGRPQWQRNASWNHNKITTHLLKG